MLPHMQRPAFTSASGSIRCLLPVPPRPLVKQLYSSLAAEQDVSRS